jgi:hypothetical protein
MTRRIACALAALALAASGCAAAGGLPETSDTPRRDLAVRPTPLPSQHAGRSTPQTTRPGHKSAQPGSTSTNGSVSGDNSDGTSAEDGGGSVASGAPAAPFHVIATLSDAARDAGLDAPPDADLRSVSLADNGASLRVTVVLNAVLPRRTADGETFGIGVDLYHRGSGRESDYQLFADGEPDGWFAYLDTPRGFVRYPGTFGLGGNRLVFTVPWSSVGNPSEGRFSGFVDWTRRSNGITGNKASNDYAPTVGTKVYSRA